MNSKPGPSLVTLLGMGVTTALCVGVGIGGGYWLDETLNTGLTFTFVGLGVGIAAAIAAVYFEIRAFL